MKKKIISIIAVFITILTLISTVSYIRWSKLSYDTEYRNQIVKLNEIKKLSEESQINPKSDSSKELNQTINSSIDDLRKDMENTSYINKGKEITVVMYILCLTLIIVTFIYIYIRIISPFYKLQNYAAEIAKGNLEISLEYEKLNIFGEFTWAFDHMRKEIIKARKFEKEAIENNKTFIATLSHDIKTPIASIRAYTEGLEANLDKSIDRRKRYTSVIIKKCDEVTNLTNDLFLHSLSDMDKLKIESEKCDIKNVIEKVVCECKDLDGLEITSENINSSTLNIDKKRMEQVLNNLIDNSRKYASIDGKCKINISTQLNDNNYIIKVHDFGNGISDEDMPFVMQKFYRGGNSKDKSGSGLGLYIVKYIVEQMDGEVKISNSKDGLLVEIVFTS